MHERFVVRSDRTAGLLRLGNGKETAYMGRHIEEMNTCELKRNIELIALDMDGTLLNEKGILAQESKDALLAAMKQGVHVVIATGRVFSALPQDVVSVPGIEYAITSNGANIVRLADRETIYSNLIDGKNLEPLMEIFHDSTIMKEIFFDHKVYAQRYCLEHLEEFGIVSERSKHYTLSTRIPVESTMDLIEENIDRLENINLIFADLEQRKQVWERLSGLPGLTVCSSIRNNLEIGGATTSKAAALETLASLLGVNRERIMACGDSSNDLAMLQYAGLSVAMGNAVDEVKQEAQLITSSNAENGVARAIEAIVLGARGAKETGGSGKSQR